MNHDADLLLRYAEHGSQAAFAEFAQRHLRLVYFCALRQTGGRADLAQDAAQSVFIQAAQKARKLSERKSLAGWLYTAARFAARDLMRSERRRIAREKIADEISREQPVDAAAAAAIRTAIDEVLCQLSEKDRELILSYYVEEMAVEQIAQQSGLSNAAVRKRIERAITKLRSVLQERGIASSTAALASILSESKGFTIPPTVLAGICKAVFAIPVPASGTILTWLEATHAVGGLAAIVATLTLGVAGFEVVAERRANSAWHDLYRARNLAVERLRQAERALSATDAKLARARAATGGGVLVVRMAWRAA